MENFVLECINKRRSVRKYDRTKPVAPEAVNQLVDAALISPSSMNAEPWNISVIRNNDVILELEKDVVEHFEKNGPEMFAQRIAERNKKIFYDAPLVFVISAEDASKMLDVGIQAQSICIAAKSLGLDSIILGLPRVAFADETNDKWREKCKFPKGYVFGIAIAVGYGLEGGRDRKPDYSKVTYID